MPQGQQGPEGLTAPPERSAGGGDASVRLHVGTSGFAYPAWKPAFYPPELPASGFLEFYSARFDTVELNNTFYRFPAEKQLADWRDRVPPAFSFAIKANQRITHYARLRDVADLTREFVERCATLDPKLGPILFGLPPKTARDDDRLGNFLTTLPAGGRYAFEFRHPSWFTPDVLDVLRGSGAALCIAESDETCAPRVATAPFVYVRLRKSAYSEPELAAWVSWLRGELGSGREAFVYVKHDEAGQGPEIARRLLAAAGIVPPQRVERVAPP